MIQYYVLSNKYKLTNSIEKKKIGVYSAIEEAENEKYRLMKQEGFVDYSNGFMIKRVFRLYNPQFLNKTFWDGGFFTYHY